MVRRVSRLSRGDLRDKQVHYATKTISDETRRQVERIWTGTYAPII